MMESTQPLVSVVIPAYNSEAMVGRAVKSVLSQDYSPLEVIVVDDGSSDGTAAAAEALGDSRVRVIRQTNAGPAAARNRGIRESNGEFIAFIDADDEWLPEHLRKSIEMFASSPDAGLVYSLIDDRLENGEREIYGERWERNRLFDRVFWPSAKMVTSGVVLRKAALEKVGLFDETLHSREDHDLFIRAGECFATRELPEPLTIKYRHGNQISSLTKDEAAEADYFNVIERAFARDPARYEPARATIMAEAWYVWGVTHLGRNQPARARQYLWRSMNSRFKWRAAWFWARTFVPVALAVRLRRWRHG
ncbi:MAG: glycosyltransferase [Candidatus Sumerlaeia bacterium]